jgi:SAM-dependent methyltransferase
MRVCLLETGGGTRAKATLAEAECLREAGAEVTILAADGSFAEIERGAPGCRVVPVQVPPGSGRLRRGWALARAAFREGADAYHAHSSFALMAVTSLAARLRLRRFYGDFNNIVLMARGAGGSAAACRPAAPGASGAAEVRFDHADHWERELSGSEQSRVEATLRLVPGGIATALDVGCGDGRITNLLPARVPEVTGLDPAEGALRFLRPPVRPALGSADRLPFGDRSFDLVLTTEVIEHLPPDAFERALAEMRRVARRHIILGVPLDEQLATKDVVCPFDGCRFNVNGHRRSFSRARLAALLAGFRMTELEECGAPVRFYYHPALRWIKQRIGGTWARRPYSICPRCGRDLYATDVVERNAVARWCDTRNLAARARRRLGRSHAVALYERAGP